MKFESLNELILSLILWITTNTNYANPEFKINVEFMEQYQLSELACSKPCEILAYTPGEPKKTIFLVKSLKPLKNVCDQGVLLHEIIHVLQNEEKSFDEYDKKTKKHLKEMDALINHNIFLSHHGKKILYSNGFAAKFKTNKNSKNNLYC